MCSIFSDDGGLGGGSTFFELFTHIAISEELRLSFIHPPHPPAFDPVQANPSEEGTYFGVRHYVNLGMWI